jgi:hypothetical protein
VCVLRILVNVPLTLGGMFRRTCHFLVRFRSRERAISTAIFGVNTWLLHAWEGHIYIGVQEVNRNKG